jgi:hypothetical protein
MDFPHPNPYAQPHINNRYIGNFMDFMIFGAGKLVVN